MKKMRCKYLLKGDGLSKQNILLTMGNVYSAIGGLLHATENISADVPQLTNNITKCALCEREKANLKAKDDFNLSLKSTHTHTHTRCKKKNTKEFRSLVVMVMSVLDLFAGVVQTLQFGCSVSQSVSLQDLSNSDPSR